MAEQPVPHSETATTECGCYVSSNTVAHLYTVYCPKHAEVDNLRDSLTWALEELQKAYGAVWEKNDWEAYRPVVDARRTLAAAGRGGA